MHMGHSPGIRGGGGEAGGMGGEGGVLFLVACIESLLLLPEALLLLLESLSPKDATQKNEKWCACAEAQHSCAR